ncbi:hypothetical protein HK096_003941 [Nowakowskiella sp. JEL0078]|nr:hypothetical protein HK096_003941 [Nowakowskiella sp. JEL0078]
MRKSLVSHNFYDISSACLFAAIKLSTTDKCVYLLKYINVCNRIASKKDIQLTEEDKEYEIWKRNILINEDLVISTICFDLQVELPHPFALELISKYCTKKEEIKRLSALAFSFCSDCLNTVLAVRFDAFIIAYIAIYMAYKAAKLSLISEEKGTSMWDDLGLCETFLQDAEREVLVLTNVSHGFKFLKKVIDNRASDMAYTKFVPPAALHVVKEKPKESILTPSPTSPSKSPMKDSLPIYPPPKPSDLALPPKPNSGAIRTIRQNASRQHAPYVAKFQRPPMPVIPRTIPLPVPVKVPVPVPVVPVQHQLLPPGVSYNNPSPYQQYTQQLQQVPHMPHSLPQVSWTQDQSIHHGSGVTGVPGWMPYYG